MHVNVRSTDQPQKGMFNHSLANAIRGKHIENLYALLTLYPVDVRPTLNHTTLHKALIDALTMPSANEPTSAVPVISALLTSVLSPAEATKAARVVLVKALELGDEVLADWASTYASPAGQPAAFPFSSVESIILPLMRLPEECWGKFVRVLRLPPVCVLQRKGRILRRLAGEGRMDAVEWLLYLVHRTSFSLSAAVACFRSLAYDGHGGVAQLLHETLLATAPESTQLHMLEFVVQHSADVNLIKRLRGERSVTASLFRLACEGGSAEKLPDGVAYFTSNFAVPQDVLLTGLVMAINKGNLLIAAHLSTLVDDITAEDDRAFKTALCNYRRNSVLEWFVRTWPNRYERVGASSYGIIPPVAFDGAFVEADVVPICAVCLETECADTMTECGHAFCRTCLAPWLALAPSSGCPICRARVRQCGPIQVVKKRQRTGDDVP